MTGPPPERGSVRNVTIDGDSRVYMAEVRSLPGSGLRVGDYCWIEFGAVWAERGAEKVRLPGQWRQCVVLPGPAGTAADVHVRLSPAIKAETPPPTQCRCDEGWQCEDHPGEPLGHGGCSGAGRRCINGDCPWWHGPKPAAMDLHAEKRLIS